MNPTRILTALFCALLLAGAVSAQALKRTTPATKSYEQGERSVNYQVGIPPATVQAYFKYMTTKYGSDDYYTSYDLYRMPNSTDLYYGTTYNGSTLSLFLFKNSGSEFTEVGRSDHDGCGLAQPFFFSGPDRVFLVVSNSAPDGGFCGNWAYEVRGGSWKTLGELDIYDAPHGKGGFQGHSPMERATAKYVSGKYYLTMRGEGKLYSFDDKLLANRGVPLTYYYDGTKWRK